MKLLVATAETQGQRKNDFMNCTEGEIVLPYAMMECTGAKVDDHCGCRRSFCGASSMKATTTAKIVDIEGYTEHDLTEVVKDYLAKGGYTELMKDMPELLNSEITTLVKSIKKLAAGFLVYSVLEHRGSNYGKRDVTKGRGK